MKKTTTKHASNAAVDAAESKMNAAEERWIAANELLSIAYDNPISLFADRKALIADIKVAAKEMALARRALRAAEKMNDVLDNANAAPDGCEYCGNPGTENNPLAQYVTSPPLDGYKVETAFLHAACAMEQATDYEA
jgi:hypothetical protein